MTETWAETEFCNLDLGDSRLNKRAVKLIETFVKAPKLSIPQACQGWTDTHKYKGSASSIYKSPHCIL
jgi:hypothetical protein